MRSQKYDMNLLSVTAMGIGSVVGAGIFALLGQVVLQAGDYAYWSFIIAGIAALFSGYSYAKLAGTYPDSGGLTDYFHIAFKSNAVSGTLSIIYLITSAISISMMAKSFGIYGSKLFPDFNPLLMTNLLASLLIIVLAALNMLKASAVGGTEILLVGIKFSVLCALVIAALLKYDFVAHQIMVTPTPLAFLGSIGVTFFAYAGYGIITNASADVRRPKTTIKLAIYLTILLVILIYVSLSSVILHFIPADDMLKNADTAVAIAAGKLFGKWGYGMMYAVAVIAFISGISATYFSIFRISYSLSEQKILPKFYHHRFWERGTLGNLLTVSLIILATILFNFNSIVNLASGAYLISYLAVFAANWRLRRETESSAFLVLTGIVLMLFILITFLISIS